MIIILTEPFDGHAHEVVQRLREREADFIVFNPAQFPTQAEISYAFNGQPQYRLGCGTSSVLRIGEQLIDLNEIKSFWYRRPELPIADENITHEPSRAFVQETCKTFIDDIWNTLNCQFLPAKPAVIQQGQLKIPQLKIAALLGFELPPTLITNSKGEFLDFYRQHNGNIISKLIGASVLRSTSDNTWYRYTEVVSKRDVGYADSVRYCPMIFQAYVPKRVELRITVVGQKVFAAEIHSQKSNHARHDWRRYDNGKTPYLPHELPHDVRQRCLKLVETMGLCYGAIDMVVTPDGRYIFIEINPNGQYLWVERATGLPISDAICDLLMFGTLVKDSQETYHEQFITAGIS